MIFVSLFLFLSTCRSALLTQIGHLYESSASIDDVNCIAIDTAHQNIYAANTVSGTIDLISYAIEHNSQDDSSKASLETTRSIDIHLQSSPYFVLDYITSIAYSPKGYMIASLIPLNYAQVTGWLVLIDTDTMYIDHFIQLKYCYSPKHVVSTADGNKLIIACEGLADGDTADPEGSITVIDTTSDDAAQWKIYNVDFTAFDSYKPLPSSIYKPRPDSRFSLNAEPEYCTVDDADRYAYCVLQENNGVAILDIEQLDIVTIFGFGAHDFGYSGLAASDTEDGININTYPNVYGLRQPDGISYYRSANGKRYILTANEGNPKYYDMLRVSDVQLDPTVFPDAEVLQQDENLGRLQIVNAGDKYGETESGEFEALYTFGSRDFAVWEVERSDDEDCPCEYPYGLRLAFSSYDDFEQITAAVVGANGFNSDLYTPSANTRSDDKGPEPESIVVGECNNGDVYVFIGLERVGGVMVYDITDIDEGNVVFVEYLYTRDFDVDYTDGTRPPETAGDIEPETLLFITDDDDDDIAYLVVGYKTSASIGVYTFDCGINRGYDADAKPVYAPGNDGSDTSDTADECLDQAPCLNVNIRPIVDADTMRRRLDTAEMYQVCLEFNDNNPFCIKGDEYFEYGMTASEEQRLGDGVTPLQWFSNDAICQTATCDAVVQFAVRDGAGCGAQTNTVVMDLDGVSDVECTVTDIYESCQWSIPTPRCNDDGIVTTTQSVATSAVVTDSVTESTETSEYTMDNQNDNGTVGNNQYSEGNKKANRNTFDTMTNKGGHFYESTMFYMLLSLCLLTCFGVVACVYKHSKQQDAQIEGDVEDAEDIEQVHEAPLEFEE